MSTIKEECLIKITESFIVHHSYFINELLACKENYVDSCFIFVNKALRDKSEKLSLLPKTKQYPSHLINEENLNRPSSNRKSGNQNRHDVATDSNKE